MRAALLLLTLALAATPALAQQKTTENAKAAPLRLRGQVSAPPMTANQPAAPVDPLTALPPLLAPLAGPVGADASRCRLSCASSYYFCLSTDAPEDCSGGWGQCRARCDSPSPVQAISTIPAGT